MKKIITIGLPYFAEKITSELKLIDSEYSYINLDTYYSYTDRLKFMFLLPFSKTLYSINGTIGKSKAISFAMALNKRIVMHWVGSDILSAKNEYFNKKFNPDFISKCIHITDTPWFVEELAKIGINARYLPLINFSSKKVVNAPFPEKFNVLIYIPQNKQKFYGIERLVKISSCLPDIEFNVVGTKYPELPCPSNVVFHGWVENIENYIKNSVVCIRIPEHDGLSFFVLESLFYMRYVLYNYPLPFTEKVVSDNDIIEKLKFFKQQFDFNMLNLNKEGSLWVQEEFSEKNILELKKILTND
jgi:hypothetical protein